jgi:hypothetical protein
MRRSDLCLLHPTRVDVELAHWNPSWPAILWSFLKGISKPELLMCWSQLVFEFNDLELSVAFLLLRAGKIHIFNVLLVLLILFHHLLYCLHIDNPVLWCLLIQNLFKGVRWFLFYLFIGFSSFLRGLPQFQTLTLVHFLENIWGFCELYRGSGNLPPLRLFNRAKPRLCRLTHWLLMCVWVIRYNISSLVFFFLGEECVSFRK